MAKKYAKSHEWIEKREDGNFYIGISEHAQELLGDVVFVELPTVGDRFEKGDELGVIESVKAASNFYAPASGEVIEVNNDIENSPDLINSSAEDEGWLCALKIINESELDDLSDEDIQEKEEE